MEIDKSIFKIITDHSAPNWESPWNKSERYQSSGTGFCILVNGKKHILTNAHCVQNYVMVKAVGRDHSSGFPVMVEAILYECDLALLSASKEHLKDVEPLRFRRWPDRLENVRVVGYPLGGHNVSFTSGVVNRVVMVPYMNITNGIALQIDAAINFGNSGGPVIDSNNYVIGVAFSAIDSSYAENMGYIIPTILINFFITALERGSFDDGNFSGLSRLNLSTQTLHNKTLRGIFHTKSNDNGILMTSAYSTIKEFDILTHIENVSINNDGNVIVKDMLDNIAGKDYIDIVNSPGTILNTNEVLPWKTMISMIHPGTKITLSILRNSVKKDIHTILSGIKFNIPQLEYQDTPRYYTFMGMIFVPLTRMLIKQIANKGHYLASLEHWASEPIAPGDEYVVLVDIYVTDFTEDFPKDNFIVDTINGIPIHSLDQMEKTVSKITKSKKEHLVIQFKDTDDIAALNNADIVKYNKKITSEYIK